MLNSGAWLPGGREDWYRRVMDAETKCSSYHNFFMIDHHGRWATEKGADRQLFYAPAACRLAPFDANALLDVLRTANISLLLVGDSLMEHTFM